MRRCGLLIDVEGVVLGLVGVVSPSVEGTGEIGLKSVSVFRAGVGEGVSMVIDVVPASMTETSSAEESLMTMTSISAAEADLGGLSDLGSRVKRKLGLSILVDDLLALGVVAIGRRMGSKRTESGVGLESEMVAELLDLRALRRCFARSSSLSL